MKENSQLSYKQMALLSIIILALTGCSSMSSSANDENEKRLTKTAKINAELGIAYLEKHNIQRAKQKLLLAINQGPNIPEPWYSMGYFMESTGETKAANDYYLKAIAIAPKRGDAQNNYGTFLCRQGQYQESIKHFDLATSDPDYLTPADAYENAGLCALKMPNTKLAIKYFDQSIQRDPARPVALLKLAEIYYKEGKYDFAKESLEQYTLITTPSQYAKELQEKIETKIIHTAQLDDEYGSSSS